MMEDTWKNACRTVSPRRTPVARVFRTMRRVAAAMTPRYVRSYSLFSACLPRPISTRKYRLKLMPNSIMKTATTHCK